MPLINTATEDELSEVLAARLIRATLPNFELGLQLRKGGSGYLRTSLSKFRQMAQREHVLLLTDLDQAACAAGLVAAWTGDNPLPPMLMLRVPVREVEAWLLADRAGFSELLGVSPARLPPNPDELADPKQALLSVARRATRRVRSELLAVRGSVASQGLGYNRVLSAFVEESWSLENALERSPSLVRTVNRLSALNNA